MYFKFYISELRVTGAGMLDAKVHLCPGLNIITGPSNTGKSYIYQCIDYVFGAERIKKLNQFSAYDNIYLELTRDDNAKITLLRKTGTKKILLYNSPIDKAIDSEPISTLDIKHDASANDNISKYILNIIGISDIVPVMSGKTRGTVATLSLRNYLHFFFVDETTIISDQCSIVRKGAFGDTILESIFRYILSGKDDGECVEIEKPEIRKAKIKGRLEFLSILSSRLVAKQERLKKQLEDFERDFTVTNIEEFQTQIKNYQEQIDALTQDLLKSESEYAVKQQQLSKDKVIFSRFTLLKEQYESDLARLEFTADGAAVSHQIETNCCPLCHTKGIVFEEDETAEEFEQAFTAEKRKIQDNLYELEPLIDEICARIKPQEMDLESMIEYINEINRDIDLIVNQRIVPLQALIEKNSERDSIKSSLLSVGQDIIATHYDVIAAEDLLKQKGEEQSYKPTILASDEIQFCDLIKEILAYWGHYSQNITLDPEKIDICIDDEDRISNGKGYRALFYSAFIYAVQQYLVLKMRPYFPCIILDSPLTTLRGADKENKQDTEAVSEGIQEAMLLHIAGLDTVQSIILENKEPSAKVEAVSNVIRFTKSKQNGRYGFFPV